jgi:probable rRNA maturation factor
MHFTHLVIHGVLHLLGYDHETEEMANEMEAIEIKIMQMAGFDNPYQAIDQS